jgi:tetratricopeptide (TPR) repeat protein
MTTRHIINICLVGLFALLVLFVASHWKAWGDTAEGVTTNGVMYKLLSCLVLAIIAGIFTVMVLLPKLGDAVGTVMYSSGEEVTADERMKAAAKMAQGDYEGAIAEYKKMAQEKPDDPFPISEIAKIHADKLEDPGAALTFLQGHLEAREWTEEHAAFLMFRIADIHLQQREYDAAKDILEQVVGNFPGTRHSANAKHKINEIEQAHFKELQIRRAAQQQQQGEQGGAPA